MKSSYMLILVLVAWSNNASSQYRFMEEMKETTIHIGSGNYFYHVDDEGKVKDLINEIIKANHMQHEKFVFNKGKNLYYSGYQINPVDDSFIYFIYAIRTREGYDVYCLYSLNRYCYFFDYEEGKQKYSLIFDPKVNNQTSFTNLPGILYQIEEPSKD